MRTPLPRMSRRGRMTIIVLAAVIVLFIALGWLVDIWTDYLWFSEVHYTSVFTTQLWTRIGLFFVFGLIMAALFWFNLWLAYRLRPMLRPHSAEQQSLERYRNLLAPRLGLWIGLLSGLVGLFSGLSAQGRWPQYLLFANAVPFDSTDPQFNVNVGFYVFDYPFLRYLLAVTAEQQGRRDEAMALYRKAYDLATAHNPPSAFVRRTVREKLKLASGS